MTRLSRLCRNGVSLTILTGPAWFDGRSRRAAVMRQAMAQRGMLYDASEPGYLAWLTRYGAPRST